MLNVLAHYLAVCLAPLDFFHILIYNGFMKRIVQLSKNVINQIAAGEVIERPYSVVKELCENSIDAGAGKISIEICNECRNIRVADNGSGIHPEDILLAFSKHATSKIETGEDLYSVKTMGFRGEALASIISVSKLTCITRTSEFDYGTKVECENSEVKKAQTGCAVGTVMDIKDLFYNLPARLKFLKSAKTEFSYINELIQSVAVIHPEIAFELKNNGKTMLKTTGTGNQLQTVKEIFGNDISKNLREVLNTDRISNLKISGYASTPDYTRASKKDYHTYVNRRTVKCPIFQKAIDMVYRDLIGSKYPFVILNLELPPEDVDVNVHPAKREVRYKNPNQIFNFIHSSVDTAVSVLQTMENPSFQRKYAPDIKETSPRTSSSPLKFVPESNIFQENSYAEYDTNVSDIFKKPAAVTELKIPKQEKFIPQYTEPDDVIIGQYKKTYIMIEREEGLEIVDQHIADERYIYERLKKTASIDSQILFISDVIEISPSDRELLALNADKLAKFGYEIGFVSEKEVMFKKIPQILSKIPPKEILADILTNISGDIDNIEESILITTSCKAAVKANTYLNNFQMQEIIRNWRQCEKPFTCPHGRPISKIIKHKDIAKFFQRAE